MKNNKTIYLTPKINLVSLDNEISLTLFSTPPEGPNERPEDEAQIPEFFTQGDVLNA